MTCLPRFFAVAAAVIFLISAASCSRRASQSASVKTSKYTYYSIDDFSVVKKYDTHVHFNIYDSTFLHQAKADNFQLLTVNVNPDYYPPIEEQLDIGSRLIKSHPQQISFATTFTVKNWTDPDWQEKTLAYLERSFREGAIAVKVWKNIGMELKDSNGKFVMIDDPRFDRIFKYIASRKIPLIGHLGEPKNCWLPVEKMTVAGDKGYFTRHPEYHMFLHPEYPSYEDQINARNNVLRKNPELQFIGAHLGSLEWSVDELAKHLEKYSNFAVDMAARIPHFQYQAITDHEKVRAFLIKYQDRLMYATDLEVTSAANTGVRNKRAHERWINDWQFFVTSDSMKVAAVEGGFKGLHLPAQVIDKIYRKNAERWFPGIVNKSRNNPALYKF